MLAFAYAFAKELTNEIHAVNRSATFAKDCEPRRTAPHPLAKISVRFFGAYKYVFMSIEIKN